jgi:hypothetical protein
MGYRVQQTTYEIFEPGVYTAAVKEIDLVDGQYGQQFKIKLELEGGHHLTVWTSTVFSGKSRLGQLAKAAFGKDIPEDYELDTDHLLRRRLRLLVTTEERPSDGSAYNKVSQFLPLQGTTTAPARPAAPAPKPPPAPSPFDDGGVFDGAPPVDERIPF